MPEIETLSLAALATAALIVFLAGLTHGTLGFGFPMVATPLLALQTDVRSAILLTLLPTVAVNVPSILHGGNWREGIGEHWPLVVYIPLGTVLGTHWLIAIDPAPFKLLLAAMIVLYLLQPRLGPGGGWLGWLHRHRALAYALFGLSAGVLAGTVNVMVPLLIIFTLELGLTTLATVQLFNLCFLTGKLVQLAAFGVAGLLVPALLGNGALLALVGIGALYLGMRLRARIDAAGYRRWLRRALAAIAVLLVLQFGLGF
ncbi:MAG TPA: sulfite exporter TauE/SafE family protein [Gammaproteobacteria bacterium]